MTEIEDVEIPCFCRTIGAQRRVGQYREHAMTASSDNSFIGNTRSSHPTNDIMIGSSCSNSQRACLHGRDLAASATAHYQLAIAFCRIDNHLVGAGQITPVGQRLDIAALAIS